MAPDHGFVVGQEGAGERIDAEVARLVPGLSRTRAARLVVEGDVLVAGRRVAPSHRVREGDDVAVHVPDAVPVDIRPEALDLAILHEDPDIVVIDKPAGLVVHPGAGRPAGTLVNALLHHCGASLSGVGGELRPGIVHRLDRGTTGVIVVAKTHDAHVALSRQFAHREVGKLYLAVVRGVPAATGRIDAPIGRSATQRTRMSVRAPRARQALTEWTLREALGRSAALLEVRLHTGRTHQVRVHLAHGGHPIVGDPDYGKADGRRLHPIAQRILERMARPALHAWQLSIVHPTTLEPMTFEAPMPEDMARLVADLRAADSKARGSSTRA